MLAAAMVIINFSDIFVEIGVGPTVIIKKNLNHDFIRVAFSISIILGLSLALIIFLLAPLISNAFNIYELTDIIKALCIIFPIKSLSVVAEALLRKNLKFKILAFRGIFSYAIGYGLVGITLALLDMGVWALVIATIAQGLLNTIFVLAASPHPKSMLFKKEIGKEIIYFGGGFTLSRVFTYFANQADNFVVARWLGASALGFYNRAYTLMKTPINLYGQMLHNVLFPALANIEDRTTQMTNVFKKGTIFLSFFSLPIMVFMIILAPEIIKVILGNQWEAAIVPFQIIAISMYFRVGYRISVTIAKSAGVIYKNAYLQVIYTILIVVASIIGKEWGVSGVAAGVTIAIFVQFILMSNLGLSISNLNWSNFIKLHIPGISFAVILTPFFILVTYFSRKFGLSDIYAIILNLLAFALITAVLIKTNAHTFLGPDFKDIINNFTNMVNKKILSFKKKKAL